MRQQVLTVKGEDGHIICRLSQLENQFAIIVRVSDRVRQGVQDWLDYGLHEWVGEGSEVEPRTTLANHPLFLERVKTYLERQFHFACELGEEQS